MARSWKEFKVWDRRSGRAMRRANKVTKTQKARTGAFSKSRHASKRMKRSIPR